MASQAKMPEKTAPLDQRPSPKFGHSSAAWLDARKAELLPVPYFHLVFTLPPAAAEIANQNKRPVYAAPMRTAAEATMTLAANPKRLGARIGMLALLNT
jgi:hypothetical protein